MYLIGKKRLRTGKRYYNLDDELSELNSANLYINEVSVDFGYWRKANAIHNWFVQNCQDGRDECQTEWVSRDQLSELQETVERVLSFQQLAVGLLPPKDGFFFGSVEYDEGYWQDLRNTKQILDQALDKKYRDWDFYYHASW